MDKKLVGVSTTDKIGLCELDHSRKGLRKLFLVPSSGSNGYSYVSYNESKSQEALFFAHNVLLATEDTLVEESVKQIRRPRAYYTHIFICLA